MGLGKYGIMKKKGDKNMIDKKTLHNCPLWRELEKQHPAFIYVVQYAGYEDVDLLVAEQVDDAGELLPPDVLEIALRRDLAPDARLEKRAEELWRAITQDVISRWASTLSKEQAQTLCETIGYQGTISLVCDSVVIPMPDLPRIWGKYHPDEYLPIEADWFVPIA